MRPKDLKDFAAFLDEFQKETDRGAALVGAAMVDDRLLQTLRAFMVSKKAAGNLLDGGTAPLGTLSSRIDAAFALGLIDAHEHREFHTIRRVRNEFAHRKHGVTFNDKQISNFCHTLQSNVPGERKEFKGKPRFLYINAVILTSLALTYRAERVSAEKRVTRKWP